MEGRKLTFSVRAHDGVDDKLCARGELGHVRVLNVIRIPGEALRPDGART